jgi:hypothetical protein
MTDKSAETIKAEITATMTANIEAMNAALADNVEGSKIWAWEKYGLGVLIVGNTSRVVSPDRATIASDSDRRVFTNGAGFQAQKMDRAQVLRATIAQTETSLAALIANFK